MAIWNVIIQRLFKRKEQPLRNNLMSIHLPAAPSPEETTSALRLLYVLAGPKVFNAAVDQIPALDDGNGETVTQAVTIEDAGFGGDTETANAAAPALDSQGLPWNAEIHAGTKMINADGSWKKRRGVDDATYASKVAGLRVVYPAPVAAPPAPVAPPAPTAGVPPAPPAPTPVAPPAPASTEVPTTFATFMRAVGGYMAGQKITMPEINEVCMQLGHASPMDMKKTPDEGASLWPMAFEMVKDKANSKMAK